MNDALLSMIGCSVVLSPVAQRMCPVVMRRRKKIPHHSPLAPPSPALGPPTAIPIWTTQLKAASHWMRPTSCLGAPPIGVWRRSAGSSLHCKVSTHPLTVNEVKNELRVFIVWESVKMEPMANWSIRSGFPKLGPGGTFWVSP